VYGPNNADPRAYRISREFASKKHDSIESGPICANPAAAQWDGAFGMSKDDSKQMSIMISYAAFRSQYLSRTLQLGVKTFR
jgi:hypothetical protein